MTEYVFPAPQTVAVPVTGSNAALAVRRVFCVGRNYADHAREMGANPDREPPFFFTKPADAVVPATGTLAYPMLTDDLHHEIEMVIAIGKEGRQIEPNDALSYIFGYSVGVDLTRRDLQAVAKKMSRPWDWAKGFDESAPCTALIPAATLGHPASGAIWLSVNGEERQRGDLSDQIWAVPDVIAYLSRSVALQPGDLIFTGTPAGVGALQPGDQVSAGIDGVAQLALRIGNH